MSLFLEPAEVYRMTGKRRYSAQRRALDSLGVRYIVAKSGEPLVRASDLDSDLDEAGKPKQSRGHRWDRIGNVRQMRP